MRRLVDVNTRTMTSFPVDSVQVLTPAEIETMMQSDQAKRLFPGNIILSNFEPFRLIPANYPIIAMELNCHVMKSIGKTNQMNISIGQACRVQGGVKYDLNFYGEDANMLIAHTLNQVTMLNQQLTSNDDVIYLDIFTHHVIDLKYVARVFKEYLQLQKQNIKVTDGAFMVCGVDLPKQLHVPATHSTKL